jgi:hypothetical protein
MNIASLGHDSYGCLEFITNDKFSVDVLAVIYAVGDVPARQLRRNSIIQVTRYII